MAGTDLGSLLGGLLGGGQAAARGNLLSALLDALGGGSGGNALPGLLQQLQEGGLGKAVESWVGTGANEPVSGPDVAQALPYQVLERVAQQTGTSPEHAADDLAQALPQAIDKLTPGGSVPEGSLEDLLRERG
ncbi:YidB family protein [Streptomyces sp. SAJ15]|uniref:YidB family protein n=1 Tax=Streptomyces sp. SAJ15 TaxID=2011095 RepID=UPI00118491D4|nr:YidB family protein [Streptomyces sp. SAJ15]TVL91382.1 hypothetical protein CD790_15555 [Streptomyces sp. SAJ15]